ncbi:amidohydrolase family protein, partial [bacterium]|nr:amidohydrolase family protein [bacterium]
MSTVPALFDVNASYGKPCMGGSDFPTIQDRLSAMDRLGISRALVWNAESVQSHALSCNQALIGSIRATPGAEVRMLPALTVSSQVLYEHDGVARLHAQFEAAGCRALRFTNATGRLSLMQLEPVLRRIRRLKPFIVLRYDQASAADILEFAAAFPDVPVVLTEVMWGPSVIVFDLMRRRKSVLCDTSWLHSFGAIELVVKHFGADRLVFGTGYKSHNGAAIGALARARITAAQRRQIAHGNLDRLTGLRATPASTSRWTANTLWPRFLEGGRLDVDIVDAHGHLGPSSGYMVEHQEERAQLEAGLAVMDRIGIRTQLVSGMQAIMGAPAEGNALLEAVLRPHAGRVSGYVSFNPVYADDLTPHLDRYFAGPVFKGFKTLCDYWRVAITDKRFAPMWAYASRHRLPVLSHTWDGDCDTPSMFKGLAGRYPHVPFILGHSGGGDGGRREAEALARTHSNVHLEWCGSFCSTVCWEETLRTVHPRQVLFGTDAMAHDFNYELGRLLSLDVPDKTLIPILGANMRRI